MQKITVKSVEERHSKDGSKTFYVLIDNKDAEFTSFDPAINALNPGAVIDAEIEVKGKYINLTEFKVVSEGIAQGSPRIGNAPIPFSGRGKSPEEIASIERQVRAYIISDLWQADKLDSTSDEVIKLRSWLGMGWGNEEAPIHGKAPLKAKATPTLKEQFAKECKRLGWDPRTDEGLELIKEWLEEHGFVTPWDDLTKEAQERALREIKEENAELGEELPY